MSPTVRSVVTYSLSAVGHTHLFDGDDVVEQRHRGDEVRGGVVLRTESQRPGEGIDLGRDKRTHVSVR